MVRGRVRYATIGNADAMTLAQARKEARKLLVSFLDTPERRDGPGAPFTSNYRRSL